MKERSRTGTVVRRNGVFGIRCSLVVLFATAAPLLTSPEAQAKPTKTQLSRAEARATEARAYFQSSLYKEAAAAFMDAYAIIKRPQLLYAAATAREKAGQHRRAYALYSMYLELPDIPGENRTYAEKKVLKLDKHMKSEPKTSGAKKGAVTGSSFPIWQAATGGGLVLGGAVSWLVARSIASDLSADQLNKTVQNQAQADSHKESAASARAWQKVAIGSTAIGVGFLAWTGWLWLKDKPKKTAWQLQPTLSPHTMGWTLTGRF
ncbi:MAG: hypothetical protein KC502_04125 [Myxococcales bacterium]|nr:hypothetical protein [Myxococcales bacterium]